VLVRICAECGEEGREGGKKKKERGKSRRIPAGSKTVSCPKNLKKRNKGRRVVLCCAPLEGGKRKKEKGGRGREDRSFEPDWSTDEKGGGENETDVNKAMTIPRRLTSQGEGDTPEPTA